MSSGIGGPLDVEVFLSNDFSAQDYANAIIEGRSAATSSRPTPDGAPQAANGARTDQTPSWRSSLGPSTKSNAVEGDVTAALSQLNVALDDVGRQIKEEVSNNSATLIKSAQDAISTEERVSQLCEEIAKLQSSVQEMKSKVTTDHALLRKLDGRLGKLQLASEVLRKAQSFVLLCRRLQAQVQAASVSGAADQSGAARMESVAEEDAPASQATEGAGELPRAAATLKAIEELVEDAQKGQSPDSAFIRLAFVQSELRRLGQVRQAIADRMEDLVVQGLRELVSTRRRTSRRRPSANTSSPQSPALLNESLQTALNLGILPDLVQDLLADLTDVVRDRTAAALDAQTLAKEAGLRGSASSRPSLASSYLARRTDNQQVSTQEMQRLSNAVSKRLQTLFLHEMPAVCKKVYSLEQVLRLRSDGREGTLLDEALKVRPNPRTGTGSACSFDCDVLGDWREAKLAFLEDPCRDTASELHQRDTRVRSDQARAWRRLPSGAELDTRVLWEGVVVHRHCLHLGATEVSTTSKIKIITPYL